MPAPTSPTTRPTVARRLRALAASTLLLAGLLPAAAAPALASHTPDPASVTIAGSLQCELGCPGDWDAGCAATHLAYDADDDVWQGAFDVPAGELGVQGAAERRLGRELRRSTRRRRRQHPARRWARRRTVKFYYDHETTGSPTTSTSSIAVAPGSFQCELGCPGDWQPDCLRSWLQDPDGDGVYTFATTALPAGELRGEGRDQRGVGRELRPGRRPGRREHPVHRPGRQREGHVQLRRARPTS